MHVIKVLELSYTLDWMTGESHLEALPGGLVREAPPIPCDRGTGRVFITTPTNAVPTQSRPTVMWGCTDHSLTRGSYRSMEERGMLPSCPPMTYICPPRTAVPSPLLGCSIGHSGTHWSRLGIYSSTERSLEFEGSIPPITNMRFEMHSAPGNFLHMLIGEMVVHVAVAML